MKQPVRLNLQISDETEKTLNSIAKQQSMSRVDMIQKSLSLFRIVGEEANKASELLIYNPKTNETKKIVGVFNDENSGLQPLIIDAVQAKIQAQVYADVMITALQDMLKERLDRFHNTPPEEMRLQDDEFIKTAKKLITELRKLNKTLGMSKENSQIPEKNKVEFAKHMNKFLDSCAGVAGKGTGFLIVAAGASLLTHIGASPDLASGLLHRLK